MEKPKSIMKNFICSLCQKKLLKRNGPYGEFFACSGYPKCSYTQKNRPSSKEGGFDIIKIPYFGADESGKGDLFGPLVITIVYLNSFLLKKIKELNINIKDSKKLKDSYILEKAPLLMNYKENFTFIIVSNEDFNQKFGYSMHLGELMTFYYVKSLNEILHQSPKSPIVIDSYTNKNAFFKHCSKLSLNVSNNITLVTQAENKYLAVAIASIISRFLFLQEITKISKLFQEKILLGASEKVKEQIKSLIQKHGWKKVQNFVKQGYKGVKSK